MGEGCERGGLRVSESRARFAGWRVAGGLRARRSCQLAGCGRSGLYGQAVCRLTDCKLANCGDERLASTRGRGGGLRPPAGGSRAPSLLRGQATCRLPAGLLRHRPTIRGIDRQPRHRPTISNGFGKLPPKSARVRAKPWLQAHRHREIAVRVPNLQRKSSNQGRIRAEEHTLARFLAADPSNPSYILSAASRAAAALFSRKREYGIKGVHGAEALVDCPFLTALRTISPSQTLWPTVLQHIAQTRTPSQALLRRIAPSRLSYQRPSKPFAPNQPPTSNPSGHRSANSPSNHQSKPSPRPTAPDTSPQISPLPATLRPPDRPRPLTNAPPSHRPDVEGPHDATPYCACATPSPSGAPTGQEPLPLCAQHHPSSIRS